MTIKKNNILRRPDLIHTRNVARGGSSGFQETRQWVHVKKIHCTEVNKNRVKYNSGDNEPHKKLMHPKFMYDFFFILNILHLQCGTTILFFFFYIAIRMLETFRWQCIFQWSQSWRYLVYTSMNVSECVVRRRFFSLPYKRTEILGTWS